MDTCHLDRDLSQGKGLGPWCCTQYLVSKLGEKIGLPGLAMVNRLLFKVYRNMFVWVFCSEQCLAIAIRRARLGAKRTFYRVRLFEDEGIWGQSDYEFVESVDGKRGREAFEFEGEDGSEKVVYVVKRLKRIVYHGLEVRVKEMQVEKKFKPVWRDDAEEQESRGRKKERGKGKSKGNEVRFANDRVEDNDMYRSQNNDWSEENTWSDWKAGNHGMDTDWENWTPANYNKDQRCDGVAMNEDIPDLVSIGPDNRMTQEDWELREALARSVEDSKPRKPKNQSFGMTAQEEEERDLRLAVDRSLQESTKRKSESPVEEEPEAKKRKEGATMRWLRG